MSLRMLHFQNETNASCPDLAGQGYRASFHTHSAARGPRKKIYHGHLEGKGPRKGEHAVVKVFRDGPGTESLCDAEIDKHRLALKLSRRFNQLHMPDPRDKVTFTLPLKSTVESLAVGQYLTRHRHGRYLDKMEWVLIEENLVRQGEYQVFIGKSGETLEKSPTALDAFLHFTYHESGRKFLLCGFQGVQTENGYILTTPCIHSEDCSFGSATDGGPKMMRRVFERHVCNNLCYSYERPSEVLSTQISRDEQDDSDTINNAEREDQTDRGCDDSGELAPAQSQRTSARDSASVKEWQGSTNSCDDVFLTNSGADIGVVDGGECTTSDSAASGFSLIGFSLGQQDTCEDLAYCCTDLSKATMDEIEEEQRKVEQERAESESRGERSDQEFRRIHLGDQIKEDKTGKRRTRFSTDGPTHRCNVQAIGGIEKRPSI